MTARILGMTFRGLPAKDAAAMGLLPGPKPGESIGSLCPNGHRHQHAGPEPSEPTHRSRLLRPRWAMLFIGQSIIIIVCLKARVKDQLGSSERTPRPTSSA